MLWVRGGKKTSVGNLGCIHISSSAQMKNVMLKWNPLVVAAIAMVLACLAAVLGFAHICGIWIGFLLDKTKWKESLRSSNMFQMLVNVHHRSIPAVE